VVPSWNAETTPGSLVEVELQARTRAGSETDWYCLGRWTFADEAFARTSVPGQEDAFGSVATDTFRAATSLTAYRLRLTLTAAGGKVPTVRLLAAIASDAVAVAGEVRVPGGAGEVELAVPSYAQSVHRGEYPEYGGGGVAWCSPTSTAMVMEYWGFGPSATDLAWVDRAFADPCVDHAARYTFDAAYDGTGNWPFNTAYAAHFGLDAFVTRLRSLQEAEPFLTRGIPLVASIAAGPGELENFPLPQGTAGHLLVIVGLTAEGDPIVNDPAAPSNDAVRRTYRRVEFERVWLEGSGGAVYVITPPGTALPPSRGNW
jgi:hypothetical protein